jgi:flavin reductase (DIM6/NTAB) family NADH-FMN oxidoreductase RutF
MSESSPSPATLPGSNIEVDSDTFRAAMRELAGGVAVVTVGNGQDITGFTATSVSSLSTRPPRLIVCIDQRSTSWLALQRYSYFGVNLLRDQERAIANRFAGRDGLKGISRYAGVRWTTLLTGTPVLENGLATLDCEVEEMLPRYDHSIVIGRVRAIGICPGSCPLVYWQGDYHPLEPIAGAAGACSGKKVLRGQDNGTIGHT